MARAVAVVSVELVDAHVDGSWCRECLLSTGVQITIAITSGLGSSLRSFRRCDECGGDQVDPPEA